MDDAWEPPDEKPVVGVVGHEDADRGPSVAETLADVLGTEGRLREGSAATRSDGDRSLVVAVGEAAVSTAVRGGVDAPVLPVGEVPGLETVALDDVGVALEAALSGDARLCPQPILEARLNGQRYRGLFDVSMVTAEPARISEYSVRTDGELVDSVRADGVVVATPAGTHGYAGAVDAPALSPALEAVAVAPIAPFATRARQWVVPNEGIELRVERDECSITLVVDDRAVGSVPIGSSVGIGVDGRLRMLVVPSGCR
ncbi:NAD(+)/NADH kinase [Natronococcus occultus]|uniref:Putative sugar kinase n=1 Tax=Natronococcus occultus SP4 TaxID=694430 RepID=L0JXN7_9EURY|nr:NAD(+)/NADH kinase [Natronococcus occultus]AGB36864.1 putative sugar kinase [Natronococcus occultus SP4]